MKNAGLYSILLLCTLILLCGCVQIIINPPGTPGAVAPVVTTSPAQPPLSDTPAPVATAQSVTPAPVTASPSDPKFIVPFGDMSRVGHRTFTFYYAPENTGTQEYMIRVPVNMSVYYGARQMKINLPASSMNPGEIKAFIASYGSDPAMDELYDNVLKELRSARYRNGNYLSDDEYLELIVAFVQQIPTVENPSPNRKYPVQVIYDKAGDSDEKSQLLAKLLSREGYDVSLMVFEDLQYETIGIRVIEQVPDASLKIFSDGKKEYIFIDVAKPAFIGAVPRSPVDFTTTDDPAIYPVGSGTKSYGMVNYVWKVVADLHNIRVTHPSVDLTVIQPWDRVGTCSWIKNKKYLNNTVCYCCDM